MPYKNKYKNKKKNTQRKLSSRNNKTKKKQTGGKTDFIQISYPSISPNQITNGADLTLYKEQLTNPSVEILSSVDMKYLVIMHDPDAPYGMNSPDKSKNNEFLHWIYTQENSKSMTGKEIKNVILPYTPPTPPYGTHHYIFDVYDYNSILENKDNNIISRITEIGKNGNRSNNTQLIKDLEKYKIPGLTFYYKVSASK